MTIIIAISYFFLFQNCATIIGGSQYYATVLVNDYPDASIKYKEVLRGHGSASFKVKRNEIRSFYLNVQEKDCTEQSFSYSDRVFRGGAFVGTVLGFAVPGIVVDLATGALWKPNVNQMGVIKTDFRHFNYVIDYTGCNQSSIDLDLIKMNPSKEM